MENGENEMRIVPDGTILKSRDIKGEIATASEFSRVKGSLVVGCYDLSDTVDMDLDKLMFKYIWIHFGKDIAEQLYDKPLFSKFIFQTPQEQLPTRLDVGNKPW
jgi:hypothetical protein